MDRVLDPRVLFLLSTAFMSSVLCQKQPNILLIVADDYGWNDIGYHGSEIKTPTLDKLASEGVKLENYYVQPICTPTRSQLLSGKYQIHTGLQHETIEARQPNCLPVEDVTLADKLKEVGYSTHAIGKWHLGHYKKACLPTRRGFDSFFGYLLGNEDYYTHSKCVGTEETDTNTTTNNLYGAKKPSTTKKDGLKKGDAQFCGIDFRDNEAPEAAYQGQYSAHVFTQKAQEVARDHAKKGEGKPLFMYLPYQNTHCPLQVPDEYVKPYSHIKNMARRTYAGMVSVLDEAVKNVTDTFKELGLADNTLILFTADNGGEVHCGGNNWPLRGYKNTLWEGGVHGVGFVTGKGITKKGSVSRGLVHVSDWFPTLIKLAGGNVTGIKIDGHDVWDTIVSGSASPRTELLHNIDPLYAPVGVRKSGSPFDNRYRSAIRSGDWKLITGQPGDPSWVPPPHLVAEVNEVNDPDAAADTVLRFSPHDHDDALPGNSVAADEYLQLLSASATSSDPDSDPEAPKQNIWLFNIALDPQERTELSAKHPDIVDKLLERLAYYNSTALPVSYPAFDPKSDPKLHGGFWGPWE